MSYWTCKITALYDPCGYIHNRKIWVKKSWVNWKGTIATFKSWRYTTTTSNIWDMLLSYIFQHFEPTRRACISIAFSYGPYYPSLIPSCTSCQLQGVAAGRRTARRRRPRPCCAGAQAPAARAQRPLMRGAGHCRAQAKVLPPAGPDWSMSKE